MTTLRISEVTKNDSGLLEMLVRRAPEQSDERLWFKLPEGFKPHSDQIACCIAAIFGTAYSKIEFLEPITAGCRKALEEITGAEWSAPEHAVPAPVGGNNIMLNFSGGFDSLAALALFGETANLISIDFGGNFKRERDFFEKFATTIIETNARQFEKSWTFMGLGTILLREYFESDYFVFGTIFEASPWNFLRRSTGITTQPIYKAAGLVSLNPIIGLTEFSTTRIAALVFPDQAVDALNSLAAPHSEKLLRKYAMLSFINARESLNIDLDGFQEKVENSPRQQLGSNSAIDFLAPGMYKFCADYFERWINVPSGFYQRFENLDPIFYLRENTGVYTDGVPPHIRRQLAAKKADLEIDPYRPSDWHNFQSVMDMLKVFHRFPGETM